MMLMLGQLLEVKCKIAVVINKLKGKAEKHIE
jgi:hypothetical protein